MKDPVISMVMPSFNQVKYIEKAIVSFLKQDYPSKELIIIDGGSTDGAVDIIRKYGSKIKYWVSESDRGQSHAINKGISVATGDLIGWLNSDDLLLPGALTRVATSWRSLQCKSCAWLVGGCLWLSPEERIILCCRARRFSRLKAHWNVVPVWGPSSFFSKRLVDEVGGIDERYHYMMDTELWLRFAKEKGLKYRVVDGYCWGLRLHPDAKMSGHNFKASPLADPLHPAWRQRRVEDNLMSQRYGVQKMPAIMRATSLLSTDYLRSRFDTWRYKGLELHEFLCDER